MCNMSFIPEQIVKNYKDQELLRFFAQLEESNGGHGNGFYYLNSGKIDKSAKIPIRYLYENPNKYGLFFHTRRLSIGGVSDLLCHPFETENYIVMHNGTWNSYLKYKKRLGIKGMVSDSYVLAQCIEHFGAPKFFRYLGRIKPHKVGKVTYLNGFGVVVAHHKETQRTFCVTSSGYNSLEALKTTAGFLYSTMFLTYRRVGKTFVKSDPIFGNWYTSESVPEGMFELTYHGFFPITSEYIGKSYEDYDLIFV